MGLLDNGHGPNRPIVSNTSLWSTSVRRDIIVDPNRLKMTLSGTIDVDSQRRQGRSPTPSSSGSVPTPQRTITKGL